MLFAEAQLPKIKRDLEEVAKEPLDVEIISGCVYAFGSELACLRLFKAYNGYERNQRTEARYSDNRESWYFCLEPTFWCW